MPYECVMYHYKVRGVDASMTWKLLVAITYMAKNYYKNYLLTVKLQRVFPSN